MEGHDFQTPSARKSGLPRGGQHERGRKRKKELGRGEWSRKSGNKRARHDRASNNDKQHFRDGEDRSLPVYATKFSAEEIAAQERRPKRKVAVMIGYSGTGYKGMQLNHNEKTIEGDLFRAFVRAGAISKANADDPKKSSLVRCARTDKGVHAAGNVISLKLVIEDPDVVAKVNENLPGQIRVWGIERTNASFSAYQLCDSRIYEYLIPTYCFLPPHPASFLGKKIVEFAEIEDDLQGLQSRQEEVAEFWSETYEKYLNPIIDLIEPPMKEEVLKRFLFPSVPKSGSNGPSTYVSDKPHKESKETPAALLESAQGMMIDETGGQACSNEADNQMLDRTSYSAESAGLKETHLCAVADSGAEISSGCETAKLEYDGDSDAQGVTSDEIEQQLRKLKTALVDARRAWRIPQRRLERVRSTFSRYVGSHKYHNYTVDKTFSDASATRVIKSFAVSEAPIIIGNTEWLSLKVHGQSFMMHQIRKMVSSAAMIVRCGCHEGRIQDTFLKDRLSIPKAPSLGLLLERPVFDSYNDKLVEFGREPINFSRYEKELAEFKQREIYESIFRDEEKDSIFLTFFSALDSTRSASLFWLTSAGLQGTATDMTGHLPVDRHTGTELAAANEGDNDSEEAVDS